MFLFIYMAILILLVESLKLKNSTNERFQNSKFIEPVYSYGRFGHANQCWCYHYHEFVLGEQLQFLAK
jgi:hypothetical protein